VPTANQQDIAFGPFKLDWRSRSLTRDGVLLSVGGRALDVLGVLASAAGETIGKEALLDQVWPGLTVEENNLQVQISALRKMLGEGWIVTIPGRGYRLTVPPAGAGGLTGGPKIGAQGPELPGTLTDKPSIAVLPFANLSSCADQDFFSDGVAEDIITELSRLRWLFVIARNSSFTFKDHAVDVKQVGRELGVRYVLEGSVRCGGDRVRVGVRLMDAKTGNHVWAERYDSHCTDLFAVQDAITREVAHAIAPAISHAERQRAIRKPPENLDAWEAHQRGLWHLAKGNAADTEQARNFFIRASQLDPFFAAPLAMRAFVEGNVVGYCDPVAFRQCLEVAETTARRAIELDPDESGALAALAWVSICDGRYATALEQAEHAIAVNPNDVVAYLTKARALAFGGRPDAAPEPLLAALRLSPRDPHSVWVLITLALAHYFAGHYADAVKAAERAIRDYHDSPHAYLWLAAALGQLDRADDAGEALRQAMAISPASFDYFVRSRPPWFRPEDYEHMLDGLRMAGWRG
jgi:adenylate cyclase